LEDNISKVESDTNVLLMNVIVKPVFSYWRKFQ